MSFTPWSRLKGTEPRPNLGVRSVAIIGAGPAGLVAAKHIAYAGYEVTVFERTAKIGGTFVHKAYDDSHLVSSKYLTAFSDLRHAPDEPAHLSLPAYVEYLRKCVSPLAARV